MKNIYVLIILTTITVSGCKKPYDDKAIGEPIYSPAEALTALNGKWVMRKATHIDQKSLTKESIDITDFYTQESLSILPNITFTSADKTYTVDTSGLAVNYFGGASGTWKFNDDTYPSEVVLLSPSGEIHITIGANLLSQSPYLSYIKDLYCGADLTMTYNIELIKN